MAVVAGSVFVTMPKAQSLGNAEPPAEFPPSTYKGTQYVDSRGCVYIRAGIDGNVSWVPRVSRSRQHVCGQTPSLTRDVATNEPQPESAAPEITVAEEAKTVKPVPRPVAKPAKVMAKTKPAPKKPAKVMAAAPKAVVKAPPVRATNRVASSTCANASEFSSKYINSGQYGPVRCGPQVHGASAGAHVQPQAASTSGNHPRYRIVSRSGHAGGTHRSVDQDARLIPKAVFSDRITAAQVQIPKGYRVVWEDGRLNPKRAEQTLRGIAQTRLIWTNTIPRRLINPHTGKDVTSTVPLVYPYTDVATQQRELGSVTIVHKDGQVIKRILKRKTAKVRQPTVSSRSTPKAIASKPAKSPVKPQTDATGATSYVQVGAFGVPSNAQAAAQRLARAGLPTRMGKVKRRNGTTLSVVMAGPFNSATAAKHGLSAAKRAGFNDAFIR